MNKKDTNYNCLPVHKDGNFAYNIYLEESFSNLPKYLETLSLQGRKICIVTDSNVRGLYAEKLEKCLSPISSQIRVFSFEAGEKNKTLDTVRKLYEFLIVEKFERQDLLVAFGGGVVGDLTGYTAATYLRGIPFIQVPTTLLAQVDSSIGGKTGVDFDSYKNMVGAFYQPALVYMNLKTLNTLSDEQFYCGMGEILKHGLIKDESYYGWIIAHMSEITERDSKTLMEMVYKSCLIKREVVEKDPYEKGERALLNMGHTIGHAIEAIKAPALLHGQCVALGTVASAYISWQRGYLSEEEFFEIRDMNVGFELPISITGIEADEVLEVTKVDKKMEAGHVKFILLKSIGQAVIDHSVTEQEMREAVEYLIRE